MSAMLRPDRTFSRGFTIVEVIVVMTVLGLLTGLLFGPLDDLYISNTTSSAQTTQDSDTRGALRQIASDLTNATNFVSGIPTPASPTGANDSSNPWIGSDTVLMASTYATDQPLSDPTRKPVSVKPACDIAQQQFIKNTYVYFIKPSTNTLYRRTMVNTPNNGTPCTTIAQKQSCTSGCDGVDAKLLGNVTSFKIDYYATSDPKNPISPITSAGIDAARFAKISIKTQPASATSRVTPTSADIRISIAQ